MTAPVIRRIELLDGSTLRAWSSAQSSLSIHSRRQALNSSSI